jgi:hypothetical protein
MSGVGALLATGKAAYLIDCRYCPMKLGYPSRSIAFHGPFRLLQHVRIEDEDEEVEVDAAQWMQLVKNWTAGKWQSSSGDPWAHI